MTCYVFAPTLIFERFHPQGKVSEAIQAYTSGISACKDSKLKTVLYSNRAACYLKSQSHLQECIDDCTSALELIPGNDDEHVIRGKLLYRRAKARFLQSETTQANNNELLQEAAKDLLTLLSLDKNNKEASKLLQAIRAKHTMNKGSPISNTLKEIPVNPEHSCKVLLGLLTNDPSSAMELGRLNGIEILWNQQTALALQVVACACSYTPFVRTFASSQISQTALADIVDNRDKDADYQMAALSVWLRFVLYLDDPDKYEEDSLVNGPCVVRSCRAALQSHNPRLIQASLEILSSWSSVENESPSLPDEQVRAMKPRELSAYKKKQYEQIMSTKKRMNDRALLFCKQGGLDTIVDAAIHCPHGNMLQREMGVVLGRMFGCIENEEDVKKVVKPMLGFYEGVTIEEVHTDFDEKEEEHGPLEEPSRRAQLTLSLLLGMPDVGVWALNRVGGIDEVRDLVQSNDVDAMFLASELVSAAASIDQARPLLAKLPLDVLLESDDYDIRSGAASAVAKLGLADKALSANEGEVMGLLQISVELLYEDTTRAIQEDLLPSVKRSDGTPKPTTAIERGVEVLSYLASKTQVKEELAFGFRPSPDSPSTALDRLVELASAPEAGDSLSAYGLATIFSLMAVSIQTLRREAFAGKEISMEQYDELQALGKTSEEKDLETGEELDPPASVQERIRRMASANVPRAMVKLLEGATDATVEQIISGLNRMASEPSVRGLIVQQGALSACLKVEKGVSPGHVMVDGLQVISACLTLVRFCRRIPLNRERRFFDKLVTVLQSCWSQRIRICSRHHNAWARSNLCYS